MMNANDNLNSSKDVGTGSFQYFGSSGSLIISMFLNYDSSISISLFLSYFSSTSPVGHSQGRSGAYLLWKMASASRFIILYKMGNQLIKHYDISKAPQFKGGLALLWNSLNKYPILVHSAQKETKPREEVSIFIYDKRTLVKNGVKNAQNIAALLKQEPTQLLTFKHPTLLEILQPLMDDTKRLVFMTEHIIGNLASLANETMQFCSSELDIKIHLLQLIEGISYLHSDAQIVHLNIAPENIYVASQKWKLSGLCFSQPANLTSSNIDFTIDAQYPNLSFIAPEIVISQRCSDKSDMFSFGMLLLLLLKFKSDQRASEPWLYKFGSAIEFRNQIAASLESLFKMAFFVQLDLSLQQLLQRLLNIDPQKRPSLKELHQSEFFMDPQVQTLNHLKKLNEMDLQQQASFLKSMGKIFMKFEPSVVKKQVLPRVMPLIVQEALMPAVILVAIEVTKNKTFLTKVEYMNTVWSNLKLATTAQSMPAQALFLIVSAIEEFYNYTTTEDVQTVLVPLYLKCLECNAFKLQEIALNKTDVVVNKVDYLFTKNKILPRLLQLCLDQNNPAIRTLAIVTLKKIHNVFDRNSISEFILPALDKMRKTQPFKQEFAEVLYEMYTTFGIQMPDELIINRLIPQLLPFLLDETLREKDYQNFADLLKNLISKVSSNRIKNILQANPTGKAIEFPPSNLQQEEQSSIFNQLPVQNEQKFDVFNQFYDNSQMPQSQLQQTNSNQLQQQLPTDQIKRLASATTPNKAISDYSPLNQPTFSPNQPTFTSNQPTFSPNQPTFSSNQPPPNQPILKQLTFSSNQPTFSSTFPQNEPIFPLNLPTQTLNQPTNFLNQPASNQSTFLINQPLSSNQMPIQQQSPQQPLQIQLNMGDQLFSYQSQPNQAPNFSTQFPVQNVTTTENFSFNQFMPPPQYQMAGNINYQPTSSQMQTNSQPVQKSKYDALFSDSDHVEVQPEKKIAFDFDPFGGSSNNTQWDFK